MVEMDFDSELSHLFDATPVFVDADRFAQTAEARFGRRILARRVALAVASLMGGGVALGGVATSGLPHRLTLAFSALQTVGGRLAQSLPSSTLALHALPTGLPLQWMAVALMLACGAWTLNRNESV